MWHQGETKPSIVCGTYQLSPQKMSVFKVGILILNLETLTAVPKKYK